MSCYAYALTRRAKPSTRQSVVVPNEVDGGSSIFTSALCSRIFITIQRLYSKLSTMYLQVYNERHVNLYVCMYMDLKTKHEGVV